MREKNKIAIYITTKSRQATTYLSGFFNYLQLTAQVHFFLSYSSLIFHSLMVRWVLSKLIPTFTNRLPSE